jgi:hypothetical protein
MQLMVNAGVTATGGYHRGAPQIIHQDVKCMGNPKVKHFKVPIKEKVEYKGKSHIQFSSMYVCTLKVTKDRHGLTLQPQDAGIAYFGFLGSQNSAESIKHGGGSGQRVEVEEDRDDSSSSDEN